MIDCLLVNAPSRLQVYQGLASEFAAIEPPVWAGLIAEYLRRRGWSVAILDAEADGLTIEETATKIKAYCPDIAAFCVYGNQPSASTQCMPAALAVGKLLDDADWPKVKMFLGTHPSSLPESVLDESPAWTYVVVGEGPYQIDDELLNGWHAEKIRRAPLIENLSETLPRQAWDELDMTKYRAHDWHCFGRLDTRNSYASLQTSLGCSFKCEFCCIQAPFGAPGMRYWSPECVLAQLEELVSVYDIKNVKIPDEMFCLNKRHVNAICDGIIERGYDVNFWAYARVDTMKDDAMLEKMKRAGFNWLGVGIESGSDFVRDGVEKGRFGNREIRDTIERVKGHGIHIAANYIFGLPDDTLESMNETLSLAQTLNTPWANFYSAQAYPGSALHKEAARRGDKLPESPGGPGWIGYSQHAYEAFPLGTRTLSRENVLDFRDQAFLTYFTDPSYLAMLKTTFDQATVDHVKKMTDMGMPKRKHRDGCETPYKADTAPLRSP